MCNGANSPNCVNNLSFDIPPEVKDGDATLAWTWFNNVGNREMYMNCAAVSFTGGQDQLDTLPTMFVANLVSINQCRTTENFNTDFLNPGKYVQEEEPLNHPLKPPMGNACGPTAAAAPIDDTTQTTAALKLTSPPSASLEVVATALSTAHLNSTTTSRVRNAMIVSPSGSGSPITCQDGAVTCSAQGFYCINDTTYGECTFGCAIPMKMSAGTSC